MIDLYQEEMINDYIDLCAGGSPLTELEIDEETYDRIGRLAEYYNLTRRQTLHRIIENYFDSEEFKRAMEAATTRQGETLKKLATAHKCEGPCPFGGEGCIK